MRNAMWMIEARRLVVPFEVGSPVLTESSAGPICWIRQSGVSTGVHVGSVG